jgi:hypothetical protein
MKTLKIGLSCFDGFIMNDELILNKPKFDSIKMPKSPQTSPFLSYLVTATLLLALSACTSLGLGQTDLGADSGQKLSGPSEPFPGTPLPPGSKVKHDKSFIVGTGENWFGRLTLDIGRDTEAAFRYFSQSYPQSGWTLISSVRTAQSLLVFTKGERNLTIQISESQYLMSGEAVLTVSPTPRSSTAPMSPTGRGGNVIVQPIR